MNCSEVESRLTECLDEAGVPEIREHLFECAECRKLWQELQTIEALNFSLSHLAGAPLDFTQRVGSQLRRQRRRQTIRTIAATVTVCCIGLAVFHGFSEQEQPALSGSAAQEFSQTLRVNRPANPILFADPLASSDFEQQYLEVILGDTTGSSSTIGFPSEIKVRRTDMGRVNLTHVSH